MDAHKELNKTLPDPFPDDLVRGPGTGGREPGDGTGGQTGRFLIGEIPAPHVILAMSQLTGLTYTYDSSTLGNLTYAYDLAGRRIAIGGSYARSGLPSTVSPTAYNANNQLTTWGTASLYYDDNGNMTADGTNSFVWNARNQMASMNYGAASFEYDAYGRRTEKTVSSVATNYLYDGANVIQELASGTPTANLLSGGIDEVFARTDSSWTANFLADGRGLGRFLRLSANRIYLRPIRQHKHLRLGEHPLPVHRTRR